MNQELKEYILAEAETDWIADYIETKAGKIDLCAFVERMVLDALHDNQTASLYLKGQLE